MVIPFTNRIKTTDAFFSTCFLPRVEMPFSSLSFPRHHRIYRARCERSHGEGTIFQIAIRPTLRCGIPQSRNLWGVSKGGRNYRETWTCYTRGQSFRHIYGKTKRYYIRRRYALIFVFSPAFVCTVRALHAPYPHGTVHTNGGREKNGYEICAIFFLF